MDRSAPLHADQVGFANDRKSILHLRWLLILACAALALASHMLEPISSGDLLPVCGFAASNLLLSAYWDRLSRKPAFDLLLAVLDTLLLSLVILVCGIAPTELFVLSLLTIFLLAVSRTVTQTVLAAMAVALLYVWMTAELRPEGMLLDPAFLIRVPFLYSVAVYFGYIVARSSAERRASRDGARERRELSTLMGILETINSSLELPRVMLAIASKVSQAVGAERCSVLLVEGDGRGLVLASSDTPELDRLEIDLSKYPEVRHAIEEREPVLIQDIQSHPLMREVRHILSGVGFNSILVVPMIHKDDLVGTLLLRAASSRDHFDARTVAFCQAIASASANALKNALLYRQMKDAAARHRATAEKFQSILEHSMDVILTTDLEGNITDFNRAAEHALGYSRAEVVGRPLTQIYRSENDRRELISELRQAGEVELQGAAMQARDGSPRAFDLTVSVLRNELGEVVGSVCVGKRAAPTH